MVAWGAQGLSVVRNTAGFCPPFGTVPAQLPALCESGRGKFARSNGTVLLTVSTSGLTRLARRRYFLPNLSRFRFVAVRSNSGLRVGVLSGLGSFGAGTWLHQL